MDPSSVSLSAPYTIFPLSLPLHQTRAKDREGSSYRACYSSPVESRKRKRNTELATAVDGEGLNIYDVSSTKVVSSYAVQPTTKFSCAPASSVLRTSKSNTFRRTYVAELAPKREIVCWKETINTKPDQTESPIQKFTNTTGAKHDVVYIHDLGVIANRSKRKDENVESGLLAVFRDGDVRFFSDDLAAKRWDYHLAPPKAGTPEAIVAYSAITNLSTARKALLKNRPDVIVPTDEATGIQDVILLNLIQAGSNVTLRLVSVPVVAGSRGPRDILSLPLAPITEAGETTATFSLHFSSGTLYRLSTHRLEIYDLSSTTPSLRSTLPISSIGLPQTHPPSLLRISATNILVATPDDVSLYDTKFSSLQARVAVQQTVQSTAVSRASTPVSSISGSIGSVYLTTYMHDLDLAIGYSQGGIVCVQVTYPRLSKSRTSDGLLIDSLCRGIGSLDLAPTDETTGSAALLQLLENKKKQITETMKRLEKEKKAGDVEGFERIFAAFVGFDLPNTGHDRNKEINGHANMVNGVESDSGSSSDNEQFTGPRAVIKHGSHVGFGSEIPAASHKPLRTDFVAAVLSLIFGLSENDAPEDEPTMNISFFPPNVLRYLLESGNFPTLALPVQNGLVHALVTFDPTLNILHHFLVRMGELSSEETIRALQLALSPPSPIKMDIDGVDTHRINVLRIALTRLSRFPTPTIIRSLRMMSSDMLLSFISLLELELSDGNEEGDHQSSIGINDVRIVAELLTAAVDAVGISGLLLEETSDILEALTSDVEGALAAVQGAVGLKNLLEELFRHTDWQELADAELPPPPPQPKKVTSLDRRLEKPPESAILERRQEKMRLKQERREQRKAAAKAGVPAPPIPPKPKTTEQPIRPRNDVRTAMTRSKPITSQTAKRRRARASDKNQRSLLARINRRREKLKPVVGHKKMLQKSGLTRLDLIKQSRPVPASQAKEDNPLLPLGVLSLRRLLDPISGKEFRGGDTTGSRVKEYWREGLTAGVYSVESMVV